MSAEEALQSLRSSLEANPSIAVLVAAQLGDETVIQRLGLSEGLAVDFRAVAQRAVFPADGGFRLRAYVDGYKPDADEIPFIELDKNEQIAGQVQDFSQVQQAELFHEDDEIVDNLRFYAIVASPSSRRRAVFFRTYSPKKELSRRTGFAALLRGGTYDRVTSKIFLFDKEVDCFAWGHYLFILQVGHFRRIFRFFEALRANGDNTVSAILKQVPVQNAGAFRAACTGQLQMLSKLAQIAKQPYFGRVTMKDILDTIKKFNIDVQIVKDGKKQKLVFDGNPKKRWLILKLLDDDYLGSTMTQERYEVNSKVPLK
jgi:hypothetical protein